MQQKKVVFKGRLRDIVIDAVQYGLGSDGGSGLDDSGREGNMAVET